MRVVSLLLFSNQWYSSGTVATNRLLLLKLLYLGFFSWCFGNLQPCEGFDLRYVNKLLLLRVLCLGFFGWYFSNFLPCKSFDLRYIFKVLDFLFRVVFVTTENERRVLSLSILIF